MKKKSLLSAILSIVLCVSLIAGSTFALFVTESDVNVAITAGNIDVTATVRDGSMKTYSYDRNVQGVVEQSPAGSFSMGGSAVVSKNEIRLTDIVPGDKVTFAIDVVNNSTVTVMYRTSVTFINNTGLAEGLVVTANGDVISTQGRYSSWQTLDVADSSTAGNIGAVDMVIDFPYTDDDQSEYLGKTCTVVYSVEAVQGNASITEYDENGFMIVDGVLEAISDEVYNATTVIIPDGVTEIGEDVSFYKAPNLETLVIPEGVKVIPSGLAAEAKALTTVVLPQTLTTIGATAFSKCNALSNCNIPDSVTFIGERAFQYTVMPALTLKAGVEYGKNAEGNANTFRGSSATTVIIEDGVTTVPKGIFRDMPNLKSVVIPASVTTLEEYAFRTCKNLDTVVVLSENLTVGGTMVFSEFDTGLGQFTIYVVNEAMKETMKKACNFNNKVKYEIIGAPAAGESVADTIKNAQAGDIVFVPAGEYTDIKAIPDGVTLIGAEGTVFKGSYRFYDNENSGNPTEDIVVQNIDFVSESGCAMEIIGNGTFIDCNFTGPRAVGYCVTTKGTLSFINCTMTAEGSALTFAESPNGAIVIDNCTITGNVGFGAAGDIDISNTAFCGNSTVSFYSSATATNCTLDPTVRFELCGNSNIRVELNGNVVASNPMARTTADILDVLVLDNLGTTSDEFVINGKILVVNANKLTEVIGESDTATLTLLDGTYVVPKVEITSKKDITIDPYFSGAFVTVDGRFDVTGKLTVNNITMTNANASDEGISKQRNNCIYAQSEGVVTCTNVIFDITKATAITTWWSTGDAQTNVTVRGCTFNCNGNRPLQIEANATIEGCTFNDQYRYSVQLTAANATINFKNNIIGQSVTSGKPVYGVQLTSDYGNSNLVINLEGNTIIDRGEEDILCVWESGVGTSNGFVDVPTITVNGGEMVSLDGWYATDAEGKVTVDALIGTTAKTYHILNENGLVWFNQQANSGNTFGGKTVVLEGDCDLFGIVWQPIAKFSGTFDGQGHTISNLTVTASSKAAFFGILAGATVKNVTFDNATVVGNHYVGVIVGWEGSESVLTTIENCHVTNSTVTATPELIGEKWDNGDKIGGIAGYTVTTIIKNCSVKDSTVGGYRDVGGILGYAHGKTSPFVTTVTGNTVENVTLAQNNAHNYKGYTKLEDYDLEAVVGEAVTSAKIEADNTVSGVSYAYSTEVEVKDSNSLKDAISSTNASEIVVDLGAGTVDMPSVNGKDVTISGTKDTVVSVYKPNMTGTDVTFNGVTVKGSGYSTGVQHVNTVTYNDVTIDGEMCLYGEKVVFNNCTFELAAGKYIWTYGAKEVEFNNCTFNTAGKAILVYNEMATTAATEKVTVNGCTFNATASDKTGNGFTCAAVEIGTGSPFEVYFTGVNTVDEDFAGLWRDKGNEVGKDNGNLVSVYENGVQVYNA